MSDHARLLTLFLPLRGRHLHTLRFLWHANRTRLPYHIIVADGAVDPDIARLLEDATTFPNLSFEYHRHDDRSYSDFYAKCAASLDRVKTPYAMLCDNDDFVLPSGIERCLAFLEANPDHVAAQATIGGFSTVERTDAWSLVLGPVSRWRSRCHDDGSYDPHSFAQADATARVRDQLATNRSLYYAIHRTAALHAIEHEIVDLDPSDLVVHEQYKALRALTMGKVHGDASAMHYLRQGNSSSRFSIKTDWFDHLLESRLPQDVRAMADRVAGHVDEGERVAVAKAVVDAFAGYLRRMLAGTYLRHRLPRLHGMKQRLAAARLALGLPRSLRVRREYARLWRDLANSGASPTILAAQRRELDAIIDTLEGTAFPDFLRKVAPDLLIRA